jgi:acyl carrier protein
MIGQWLGVLLFRIIHCRANYYKTALTMDDVIFENLKKFIYNQGFGYTLPFPFLFKKKVLTRESCIESDLRISGDDADEFLVDFGKEFKVNISKFPIGDYFNDEGDPWLPALLRSILGRKARKAKSLTIGQLEKAVLAGRLDEEVINS